MEESEELEMKFVPPDPLQADDEDESTPSMAVFCEIKSEPPELEEEMEEQEDIDLSRVKCEQSLKEEKDCEGQEAENVKAEAEEMEPEYVDLSLVKCEQTLEEEEEEDSEMRDKRNKRTWKEESMIQAISAIRKKKMNINKAEKMYNIPKTSLRRYANMKDKSPEELVRRSKPGRKPIFSKSTESELVSYLLQLEKRYFGVTKHDIRTFALQLAMRKHLSNFSQLRGSSSKDWMNAFVNRHKNKLSIRKGNALPPTKGLCRKDVFAFFDTLESELQNQVYAPSRIYSVDDTGMLVLQEKSPKVICLKGKTQKCILKSAENGLLVNVIACANAEGSYIPPLMVFPLKDMLPKSRAPEGTKFSPHLSYWFNCDLFYEWFLDFVNTVKPTENDPVLLILDGHNSYTRSIDLLDKAKSSHVNILALPAHTSEKLQPLEIFNRVLKDNYIREVRIHRHLAGRDVLPADVAELFAKAYMRTQTTENAVKGFETTGICPFNRGVFADVDFAPDEEEEMFEIETMMQQELSEAAAQEDSD